MSHTIDSGNQGPPNGPPNDGHNGATEQDVLDAFQQILEHFEELASERGSYMTRCKQIRERIKGVYAEASDRGITKKILKAKVDEHHLQQKVEAIRDNLEDDDRKEFDRLTEVLGEFGYTPLGQAALAGAKARDEARADA
jgi:uncharacterized protein (UPF0335 family)